MIMKITPIIKTMTTRAIARFVVKNENFLLDDEDEVALDVFLSSAVGSIFVVGIFRIAYVLLFLSFPL